MEGGRGPTDRPEGGYRPGRGAWGVFPPDSLLQRGALLQLGVLLQLGALLERGAYLIWS
jgi:hypothetical protein